MFEFTEEAEKEREAEIAEHLRKKALDAKPSGVLQSQKKEYLLVLREEKLKKNREKANKYRAKNKERLNKVSKEYYEKNKEAMKARMKKNYQARKDAK